MNDLNELVGRKVSAMIGCDEDENEFWADVTVLSVSIEDYYFEDKQEPIYISLSVAIIGSVPDFIDYENLACVPLENIRSK